MKKSRAEGWVRLGLGTVLNVVLWQLFHRLATWSGIEQEFRHIMVGGSIGAAALVFVIPVFWRGEAWQAPLAFVLMPQPGLALFQAVYFVVKYS